MARQKRSTFLETVTRWVKTISPRKYAITSISSNGVEVTRLVDFNTYCEEGYKRNAVVYSAVREIARTAPSARLQVHKRLGQGQTEIQEDNPIQDLLDFPNPWQSHYDFLETLITYLNLDGNAYIIREREGVNTKAMWLPRPDLMSAVVDGKKSIFEANALLGYAYITQTGEKLYFLPEDVIHIKYPNPNDPHGGMGRGHPPLMAAAADADNDNNQTTFIKQFFKNGAVPSGIIKSKNILDDGEVRRIQSRIGEQYSGEANWHKVMVLDADAEYQQTGLNLDQMVFPDLRAISETRICAAFKVPPVLIGVKAGLDAATYSNYALARRALWEDNIIPTTTKLAEALTLALSDEMDEDVIIVADYSNVVALQDDRTNRFARANQAVIGGWITVNEARREVGLGPLPMGVGDVLYRPLMSEAVDDGAGDASRKMTPLLTSPLKERGIKKTDGSSVWPASPDAGTSLMQLDAASAWKAFDRVARKWEGQFKRTAARLFEEEEREIEGRINGMKGKSIKAIDFEAILTAIATFMAVESVKKWQTEFLPLMMGLMQEQLSAWIGSVGIDWDIENPAVADFIRSHSFAFAQRISDTTMEDVKRLILAAQGEGWSTVRLMDELKAVYGGWSDLRAEMIARSETIRSSNAGLVEGYKQNGITQIEWYAALDERLCPFCNEMHGKQIAIGEAWFEGGSEMYVGQERLVMDYGDVYWPPLHPNCRCVMQPVIGD
jgi:HK97 family phage portal protein